MDTYSSLHERFIDRQRSVVVLIMIAVMLFLLPVGAWALDGDLQDFFTNGTWRVPYLPVVMIYYVLLVSQLLFRSNNAALQAFRSVVLMEDEAYDQLLRQASQFKLSHELSAIGIGIVLGLLSVMNWGLGSGFSWGKLYLYLSVSAMYALLVWSLVATISWTRLTKVLHRQELHFDLFDIRPFEPVGRQSLVITLVIIGGLSISLLLTFQPESLRNPVFWVVYSLLVLFPVLIFFLSMSPTHSVLAAEKKRLLQQVEALILDTSRELVHQIEQGKIPERFVETNTLAAELSALSFYKQHIQSTRTWPYNTGMLRTVFFSVLLPIGTLIARILSDLHLGDF